MPEPTTADIQSVPLDELRALRGQTFAGMDAIYTTARDDGRDVLTDEERTEYDALRARFDEIEAELNARSAADAAARHAADHTAARSRAVAPAFIVDAGEPLSARRSLDELFWTTAEHVAAGSHDQAGRFHQDMFGARNAVEPVMVRSLAGDLVEAPRVADFGDGHVRLVRSFQQTVTSMILFGLLTGRRGQQLDSRTAFQYAREHGPFATRYERLLRALDVDTSGEGANWVPTGIGALLHERVRASGRVAPLFARIQMPTNPWRWPLEGADATAYRVAEPTGDAESKFTASTPGTGGATFDAEIFGARTLFSRSLDADSAVAVLGFVEGKIAQAFSNAEERAILDGDADGTHQDSDVGASTTDARTAWDGLRKKALAQTNVDGGNAALSATLIRSGRALMGKWGLNPASIAHIVGVSGIYDLMADADFRTVDKFGPSAVVLAGQLGAADGVPVIVSEFVREDLNAAGVYDGVTTNRSYALTVNRGEFAIGEREPLDVEVDDSVYRETYQRLVVGFQREDFQHIGDAAANDDVAIVRNLA